MRNGIILTLHIIPNRKLRTICFQMAVCWVGTLNYSNNALEFDHSTFRFSLSKRFLQDLNDVFSVKGQLQRFHKLSLFDRFRHVENGLDINF